MLKDDGALWVIGCYHNIFRVGAMLQDLGFWILNDVIWRKTNPMPNFRGTRFTNAHETLIWAAKSRDQKRYTFNYDAMKALNDEVQMRSDWTLPLCSGEERLKDEAAEGAPDPEARGAAASRDRWPPPSRAMWSSIRSSARAPPAPWPSGSAARFIGIEREPKLRDAWRASASPRSCRATARTCEVMRSKRAEPRMPFGWVVEARPIAAGRRSAARPSASTGARCAPTARWCAAMLTGSIHQASALTCSRRPPATAGPSGTMSTKESSF